MKPHGRGDSRAERIEVIGRLVWRKASTREITRTVGRGESDISFDRQRATSTYRGRSVQGTETSIVATIADADPRRGTLVCSFVPSETVAVAKLAIGAEVTVRGVLVDVREAQGKRSAAMSGCELLAPKPLDGE